MTIYECDRCHTQFNERKSLHRVDLILHDVWCNEIGGELCETCINEIIVLFNNFMKGVNPYGTTESDTGNED